jgi:hypothetical protein
MVGILLENGKVDTSFNPKGFKMYDLGGTSDFFWAAALSPDNKTVAIVGAKGVAMAADDDDAAIMLMPASP